jgi:acetolactate synthase-1/2/3 large subunit
VQLLTAQRLARTDGSRTDGTRMKIFGAQRREPAELDSRPSPGRVAIILGGTAVGELEVLRAVSALCQTLNAALRPQPPAADGSATAASDDSAAGGGGGGGRAGASAPPGAIAPPLEFAVACCVSNFAKIERGADCPPLVKIPYFPQQASRFLAQFELVLLCGTTPPVAQFGYRDGPSDLLAGGAAGGPRTAQISHADLAAAFAFLDVRCAQLLARLAGGRVPPTAPLPTAMPSTPLPLPAAGPLSALALCQTLACLQPAECVVVDESLTSGSSYWDASARCPRRFSHLTLTGGAIGSGLPMALGAAVACPSRYVIAFQSDGSGMYSMQALWTMARERLSNVTVIVCANHAYQILDLEMDMQRPKHSRAQGPGLCDDGESRAQAHRAAVEALTSLEQPRVDGLALAAGCGVVAQRVETVGELADALRESFAERSDGPRLIEAVLAQRRRPSR